MHSLNYEWIKGMHCLDTSVPEAQVEGEIIYTLYMRDLLRMPNVDFGCLSTVDVSLKSLFN